MNDAVKTNTKWRKRLGYLLAFFLLLGISITSRVLWRPSRQEEAGQRNWLDCKDRILTAWAVQDKAHVRERLKVVDTYTFGWDFGTLSAGDITELKVAFDWNGRTREAEKLGVSEAQLIALDQEILRTCGGFPQYTDKWPSGRKRLK